MSVRRIELRIEELLLEGASRSEASRAGDALERELARLVAERGVPLALWGRDGVESVDAGSLDGSTRVGGDLFGVKLARAVYGALE